MVIGICDDEQKSVDIIKEYCDKLQSEIGEDFVYRIYMSGVEVLECADDIDILLLDVDMDGLNGIETMKQVENGDKIKNILFVSGYSEHVFDAFGPKTRGFICKPVEYDRFSEEVRKIINKKKSEIIEISQDGTEVFIDIVEIVYLLSEKNYVRIVTTKEEYLIYGNLKYWEDKLEKYNIIRVHKSYLVNLDYVSNIRKMVTLTETGRQIPVGRKYKEESKNKYKEYLFKKFREKTNG